MLPVLTWLEFRTRGFRFVIVISFTISVLLLFYYIQGAIFYKNTFWTARIIIPIIVGTIMGYLMTVILNLYIAHKRNKGIRRDYEQLKVINSLLVKSGQDSTDDYLESMMEIVFNAPVSGKAKKLAVFLKDSAGSYQLKSQKGIHPEIAQYYEENGIFKYDELCGQPIEFIESSQRSIRGKKNACPLMKDQDALIVPFRFDSVPFGLIIYFFESEDELHDDEGYLMSLSHIISLGIKSVLYRDKIELLNSELRAQNSELVKRNHELDRFVYSATHDLRSPLLSILGLLRLLTNHTLPDKERAEILSAMEDLLLQSDETLIEIIEYSKNQNSAVVKEEIEVEKILQDIIEKYKQVENINWKVQIPQEIKLNSDKSRLRIILSTIISNSVKYRNPDQPTDISIKSYASDSDIVFEIADTGIGIPLHYQDKIFQMFFRASANASGSGLGLYVCKEMIDKLGGSIDYHSLEGEGTTFTVQLKR